MDNQINKSYYAIIPAPVRYDKDLKPNAKLLYGEITALSNERGFCWASNAYFSELYNVHEKTISRWISQLTKKKYIFVQYEKRGFEVTERKIYVLGEQKDHPSGDKKITRSGDEKVTYNNTVNNPLSLLTKDKKNRVKTDEEVLFKDYIINTFNKARNENGKDEITVGIHIRSIWKIVSLKSKTDFESHFRIFMQRYNKSSRFEKGFNYEIEPNYFWRIYDQLK